MSRLIVLLVILLAGHPVRALETDRQYGEAGFKFLKLPLSPRIIGLGGAGVGLGDEVGSVDLNPAAAAADSGHLVVGKGYPFAEFQASSSHITWSIPVDGGYRVLLNARYLGFDDIQGFDDQDDSTSPYGAHSLKLQAGGAGRWGALDWGATFNYAGNSIASANYATAMVNLGARYAVLPGLTAGASVINADFWASGAKDENNRDPFPPTAAQAGLAYSHALGADWRAAVAVDARTRNDEQMVFPAGMEIGWRNMITARAGFPFAEQEPGFAAGLGLHWSLFRFAYAFQSHATLGPGHWWSLDLAY